MTTDETRRLCGQLLSVGFEGTGVPAGLRQRIAGGAVGGVMLFGPNVENPAQVAALVTRLRQARTQGPPLVVSVDQEGGRVQRIRAPLTVWPPMRAVGQAGDEARTRQLGRCLGAELAALGIGWNLAPVLDVDSNPANPVIGDRSFGTTADVVTTHGLAFWRGLREAGVAGCGKHFPGHGDTALDSHVALPEVNRDRAGLDAIELAPFVAAIREGAEALMIAHVVYGGLDPTAPASLSARIATALLRDELRFGGVLVSDDLDMAGFAERGDIRELIVASLMAGVDHFLIRRPEERQAAAYEALVNATETEPAVKARVQEAAGRFEAFRSQVNVPLPLPGALLPSVLGTPAHRALAGWFARS